MYATRGSEPIHEHYDELLREADTRCLVRGLRGARRKGHPDSETVVLRRG